MFPFQRSNALLFVLSRVQELVHIGLRLLRHVREEAVLVAFLLLRFPFWLLLFLTGEPGENAPLLLWDAEQRWLITASLDLLLGLQAFLLHVGTGRLRGLLCRKEQRRGGRIRRKRG